MRRFTKFTVKGAGIVRPAEIELRPDDSGLRVYRDDVDLFVGECRVAVFETRGGASRLVVKKDVLADLGIELEVK